MSLSMVSSFRMQGVNASFLGLSSGQRPLAEVADHLFVPAGRQHLHAEHSLDLGHRPGDGSPARMLT